LIDCVRHRRLSVSVILRDLSDRHECPVENDVEECTSYVDVMAVGTMKNQEGSDIDQESDAVRECGEYGKTVVSISMIPIHRPVVGGSSE